MNLPYFDAATLYERIDPATAVQILADALAAGLDPELDSPRLFAPTQRGEFLIMPALGAERNGVKVLTIDPQNTAVGLPKIQAPTCCSTPLPVRCWRCWMAPRSRRCAPRAPRCWRCARWPRRPRSSAQGRRCWSTARAFS
ncbi:hypothetical protein [Arthrobacter sp. JCM 19049]|uniref:hypothetical protein n=1 Tax=Arthrobacter sp. JCM 19049 TaxID=1460643 RepID=UPI000AF777CF|nr:hypothetical protein [Arthrobacter sp. JCM 19049]